ncbi:MAG: hypothetical protein WDA59_01785 [Methanofastidiosum sp.]
MIFAIIMLLGSIVFYIIGIGRIPEDFEWMKLIFLSFYWLILGIGSSIEYWIKRSKH